MNLGNFTVKAAEAFQQAQQLAFNAQNPNIETEHILKALLEQEDSTVEYLLKKNNVTINLLESKLDELIGDVDQLVVQVSDRAKSRTAQPVFVKLPDRPATSSPPRSWM